VGLYAPTIGGSGYHGDIDADGDVAGCHLADCSDQRTGVDDTGYSQGAPEGPPTLR
jgi:hypothetical protein